MFNCHKAIRLINEQIDGKLYAIDDAYAHDTLCESDILFIS